MSTLTAADTLAAASRYPHEADHGFCVVCGGVWPCARATPTTPTVPLPR